QGGALGAQAAEVGRMLGVAAHAGDDAARVLDDDAAAGAAIAAGRAGLPWALPRLQVVDVDSLHGCVHAAMQAGAWARPVVSQPSAATSPTTMMAGEVSPSPAMRPGSSAKLPRTWCCCGSEPEAM